MMATSEHLQIKHTLTGVVVVEREAAQDAVFEDLIATAMREGDTKTLESWQRAYAYIQEKRA